MALQDIKDAVAKAEAKAERPQGSVKLIAVSKKQPDDRVLKALEDGHRVFGENRVQEAAGKWPGFKKQFDGVELHLLGPLQTNKARQAMELFDVIHSLDREKLARRLATLKDELGQCPELFVQVNTGRGPQKAGVDPEDTQGFVDLCRELDLPVIGLMCIPPAEEEPSLHFALLAKLAKEAGLDALSMGMSGDFESAIAQGATHARVGSAIFGERV